MATYCLAMRVDMEFTTEAARNFAYSDIRGQCVDHGTGATEKLGHFDKWEKVPEDVPTDIRTDVTREIL